MLVSRLFPLFIFAAAAAADEPPPSTTTPDPALSHPSPSPGPTAGVNPEAKGATPDVRKGSGPNGSQEWMNRGIKKPTGWDPPFLSLHSLVHISKEEFYKGVGKKCKQVPLPLPLPLVAGCLTEKGSMITSLRLRGRATGLIRRFSHALVSPLQL